MDAALARAAGIFMRGNLLFAKPAAAAYAGHRGRDRFARLALRAWATGHLRKNDALAVTGPYAYTRNPLYLGSFLIGVGFTIASGRFVLGFLFAALFLGIYVPVKIGRASCRERV